MTVRGALAAVPVLAAFAAVAAEPRPAGGARTLTCEFSTVQTGQFKGLTYLGTPPDSGIILTLVASAADAGAGRAVMIAGDRASVVALVVQPRQTLFIDSGTRDDAAVVTVFTAARQDTAIPATYARQMMFGAVPVVSQYTGLCRPQ